MSAQVIDLDDVEAVDELPVDAVLICRVGEVFQVKRVGSFAGPGTARAWFALGYGDRVWSAAEVASWGPLTVLWPLPDEADVSRETSEAADPMLVQLGTLVDVIPRARTKATLTDSVATRGTFIRWAGTGALDRDAVVELEVAGRLTAFRTRDYSVRVVR